MPRRANENWNLPEQITWEHVAIAVLMDIRDELRLIRQTLHCRNFQRIPAKLDRIGRNTERRRRPKGSKAP